jgi:hypothetical protein
MWTDEVDEILAGDLVAALAYLTPAGGAVATPVCPLGLRDRDQDRVGFTTSTGYGRKLERIAADNRVALAFHTRTHGHTDRPGFVLAQGEASVDTTKATLARAAAQAPLYLGPLATGWFWDRWLRVYYQRRVVVWIQLRRIAVRAPTALWCRSSASRSPTRHRRSRGRPGTGAFPVSTPSAQVVASLRNPTGS